MITMSLTPEQELEMYADIKVIKDKLERDYGSIADHEERIKKLERAYWWVAGACAVVSYFISRFLS